MRSPMTCDQSENLSRFHDGELSAEAEATLRDHLLACPPCRAELAQLRVLSAAFDAADRPRLSATARRRILEVAGTPAWVRLVLPVARPFAAAAMLLLAVGLPVLVLAQSSTSAHGSELLGWEETAVTHSVPDSTSARLIPHSPVAELLGDDLQGRK